MLEPEQCRSLIAKAMGVFIKPIIEKIKKKKNFEKENKKKIIGKSFFTPYTESEEEIKEVKINSRKGEKTQASNRKIFLFIDCTQNQEFSSSIKRQKFPKIQNLRLIGLAITTLIFQIFLAFYLSIYTPGITKTDSSLFLELLPGIGIIHTLLSMVEFFLAKPSKKYSDLEILTLILDFFKFIFLGVIYSNKLGVIWILLSIPFLEKIFVFCLIRDNFNCSFSDHLNSLFDLVLMGIGIKVAGGNPNLDSGIFTVPFFALVSVFFMLGLMRNDEQKKSDKNIFGCFVAISVLWIGLSFCLGVVFKGNELISVRVYYLRLSYFLIILSILSNLACLILIFFPQLGQKSSKKTVRFNNN